MRTVILKPEEWDRVNASDLPQLLPYVHPEDVALVGVEDDTGEIVACVSVMRATHFEGLWIRPDQRGNAGVFRALIRQAYALPRSKGEQFVLAGFEKTDDRMRSLCSRLGGQSLKSEFYALPIEV